MRSDVGRTDVSFLRTDDSFFSVMASYKENTVFLHTSKMYSPSYKEIFLKVTETVVSNKARFVIVMSDGVRDCGIQTKDEILSAAKDLFKIYEEE